MTVPRLTADRSGLTALLGLFDHTSHLLVAGSEANGTWRLSPALRLAGDERPFATATGEGGLAIAIVAASGRKSLVSSDFSARAWRRYPALPDKTEAVAYGAAGRIDALAVGSTRLTDWTIDPTRRRWIEAQVLDVPIQSGSSG